jgi:hypothetical protein
VNAHLAQKSGFDKARAESFRSLRRSKKYKSALIALRESCIEENGESPATAKKRRRIEPTPSTDSKDHDKSYEPLGERVPATDEPVGAKNENADLAPGLAPSVLIPPSHHLENPTRSLLIAKDLGGSMFYPLKYRFTPSIRRWARLSPGLQKPPNPPFFILQG